MISLEPSLKHWVIWHTWIFCKDFFHLTLSLSLSLAPCSFSRIFLIVFFTTQVFALQSLCWDSSFTHWNLLLFEVSECAIQLPFWPCSEYQCDCVGFEIQSIQWMWFALLPYGWRLLIQSKLWFSQSVPVSLSLSLFNSFSLSSSLSVSVHIDASFASRCGKLNLGREAGVFLGNTEKNHWDWDGIRDASTLSRVLRMSVYCGHWSMRSASCLAAEWNSILCSYQRVCGISGEHYLPVHHQLFNHPLSR